MEFNGTLFTYNEANHLTAFETGPANAANVLVVIGGLGDGYNALPFIPLLLTSLISIGWSMIQVQLSSSYTGFGIVNLQSDATELDYLVNYLTTERHKQNIVFLGHSTGSQDCYWHNKYGKTSDQVLGYILQGPGSDREYMASVIPNLEDYAQQAKSMIDAGNGQEIMPRKVSFAEVPTTADRYFSLYSFGGDDDVFSTDLPDDMLQSLYTGIERPMAMVHSADDEYYASKVPPLDFLKRLQSFCPAIKKVGLLDNGGHTVTTKQGQEQLSTFVLEFIKYLLDGKQIK